MAAPIDLYYWTTPNGWKVSIALEEMGLPYTVKLVDIDNGEQNNPEFLALAPNAKIPMIVDPEGPDGAPIAVFESGAILQYLARKTGQFYGPTETRSRSVDMWVMWQMSGLGPIAGQTHHFLRALGRRNPPVVHDYPNERFTKEVARLYKVLDEQLGRTRYVAGDFYSIADMCIWPWASQWMRQGQTMHDKHNMRRWLVEVGHRPAVRKGRLIEAHRRGEDPDEIAHREELMGVTGTHKVP